MPWYRVGTVAITAGQTTVTGTGTNFPANARVGDAFQGPDGRWYEVTNIASATVISILPAYLGATVAAGTYGLAPMQGYVKESADRLRQLVDQFGATLAGLGAVSTENVVPVTKGGTGGTTQATAKAGLGLGSAADATLVANNDDQTASRVLTVGYKGMGSPSAPGTADLNVMTGGGIQGISSGTLNSLAGYGSGSLLHSMQFSATEGFQLLSKRETTGRFAVRRMVSGVLGAWAEPLLPRDMVGIVSQSAGAPTGAIIERGQNSNGQFIKYADGTMIVWGSFTTANIAAGATSATTIPFPASFISAATSTAQITCEPLNNWDHYGVIGTTSMAVSQVACFIRNGASAAQQFALRFLVIGRWF